MLHQAHVEVLRNILSSEISDTFKEINGCRPRFYGFSTMPIAELMKEADALIEESDAIYKEQLAYEKAEEIRMSNLNLELHTVQKNSSFGDALKLAMEK